MITKERPCAVTPPHRQHQFTNVKAPSPQTQALNKCTIMILPTNCSKTKRQKLDKKIRDYWDTRDRLLIVGDTIFLDNRVVIPSTLEKHVLSALHSRSVHQEATSMRSRTNTTVYWPERNMDIKTTVCNCKFCNAIATKQQQELLVMKPSPS